MREYGIKGKQKMADLFNNGFDEATIQTVWEKADARGVKDPSKWRKDYAGAWISRSGYGNTSSELGYGWEIDHQKPKSAGGSDNLSNLVPLQWSNNRTKGDNYPRWQTSVSSNGGNNVRRAQSWHISQ